MLTLHKLISRGVQEAISVLEGAKKQSADAYSIGSTVQPVVDVNKGIVKYLSGSAAGNSSLSWYVPVGKIWKLEVAKITIVCDSTVADRNIQVWHYCKEDISNFGVLNIQGPTAAASATKISYIDRTSFDGQQDTVYSSCMYDVRFLSGDRLLVIVNGGVAGDALSGYFRIREFDVVD